MNLHEEPFIMIKNETKKVEMRLNDEKRCNITSGDIIIFTNNLTNEELRVVVIDVKKYDDFYSLYNEYEKTEIGYKEDEVKDPIDMEKYYSKEKIKKYGVVAIRIKLIK